MTTFHVTLDDLDVAALEQFARARQTGIVAGHLTAQPLDTALARVLRAASHDYVDGDTLVIERTWIEPTDEAHDSSLTGGDAS